MTEVLVLIAAIGLYRQLLGWITLRLIAIAVGFVVDWTSMNHT